VLRNKGWTSLITVAVLVLSGYGARNLGAEFTPQEDRSQFMVDLQLGDGASLAETTLRTATAESVLKAIPEITDVYSIVGLNGDVNRARLRVLTTDKQSRERGVQAIKEDARAGTRFRIGARRTGEMEQFWHRPAFNPAL
jgi:multidrug efflux pump subunit AcrB